MNNNLLKFALAASLILNLTVLATAGYIIISSPRSWVSPFGKVMEKDKFLFEELSLKPEQSATMKSKAIPFARDRPAKAGNRRERIELVALMRHQNTDKKAIDVTIKEISGKQEAMQRMIVGHMLEVKCLSMRTSSGSYSISSNATWSEAGSSRVRPRTDRCSPTEIRIAPHEVVAKEAEMIS